MPQTLSPRAAYMIATRSDYGGDHCECEPCNVIRTHAATLSDDAPVTPRPDADDDVETVDCEECGDATPIDDTRTVCDQNWCGDCFDSSAFTCQRCSENYRDDDARTVSVPSRRNGYRSLESQTWCDSCVSDHAFTCGNCETDFSDAEAHDVDGSQWCRSCRNNDARSCVRCCQAYRRDDLVENDDGEMACESCAEATRTPAGSARVGEYHSTKNRGFSPILSPSVGFSFRKVQARDYDGRKIGAPVDCPMLFGVEAEIEATGSKRPGEIAALVKEQIGALFAGAERDGSLSNGVECITQPATIDVHRAAWSKLNLDGTGARSHDTRTCGLHVHVSRNAVSDLTWAKVVEMFGNPSDESTWSKVFRRTPNQYARACKKDKLSRGAEHDPERYSTVNTSPDDTVEFRWPKGTIKGATIVATIELIHAAIRYCEHHSAQALNWLAFRTWICADAWARSETVGARAYLRRRGLLTPAHDKSARPRPAAYAEPAIAANADGE